MWSHWDSDGIPVGLTWDRVGMPMGLLWEYIGVQVCLQWGSCGIQMGFLPDLSRIFMVILLDVYWITAGCIWDSLTCSCRACNIIIIDHHEQAVHDNADA